MSIIKILYLLYISLITSLRSDEKDKVRLHKKPEKLKLTSTEILIILVVVLIFILITAFVAMHGSLESTQYYYRLDNLT